MAKHPDITPASSQDADSSQRIIVLQEFCTRLCGTDCERCLLACPHEALSLSSKGKPLIDASLCTSCGICLGICDSFTSSRVTMIDLHERIRRIAQRGEDVVLTCKDNIFPGLEPAANVVVLPCLAMLSPEFWTLILSENVPVKITADLAYCADCERAGDMGEVLYGHAVQTAEAWSGRMVGYLDEIPEKENLLKDLTNPEGVDRRSAFTNLVGDVGDIASGKRRLRNSDVLQQFYERKERARAQARLNFDDNEFLENFVPDGTTKQKLWPKRRLLLEAIDRDPAIASRASLVIAETDCALCVNTGACASVCPTGARSIDPHRGTLGFDVRYCIGCGLCVAACTEGAVQLVDTTAVVLLPKQEDES